MLEVMKIKKGMTAFLQRSFTEEEVRRSNELTRDFSPVYNREHDEWQAYYDRPIVPALLTEGIITEIISTKLPGTPSILLQKDLVFYSPVHVGELISVEMIVIDINEERNWVTQKVICRDEDGKELIKGQVVLLLLSNQNVGDDDATRT